MEAAILLGQFNETLRLINLKDLIGFILKEIVSFFIWNMFELI